MLKGNVTLELRDGITGKIKERIEGHNTFTNAIPSLLNKCPMGVDRRQLVPNTGNYNNTTDIVSNLAETALGGILLFPNVVDGVDTSTNPYTYDLNQFYEKWSHQPTGYARIGAQDTEDPKSGTYNGNMSGPIPGGYHFEYDFATSQAIGDIRTIALTNRFGGEAYAQTNFFAQTLLTNGYYSSESVKWMLLGFHNGYVYITDGYNIFGTGKKIYRQKFPLNEILINQLPFSVDNSEVVYTNDVGAARVCLSDDDDAIYILSDGSSSNEKVLTTIDLSGSTPSTSTTTLTFGSEYGVTAAIENCHVFAKRGNYMYIVNSKGITNTILKFNPNSMGQISKISAPTNGSFANLYYNADNGNIDSSKFVIDVADGVTSVTPYSTEYTPAIRYGVWQSFSRYPYGSNEAGRLPLNWFVNPTYLATKYVLDAPVNKSISQTAKIIYEVTHV